MSHSKSRQKICSQIARSLKELRVRRGLSMTELAVKAGLSRAMISFVEHELRNPTLDTLLRIAEVLDVDLGKMITQARRDATGK